MHTFISVSSSGPNGWSTVPKSKKKSDKSSVISSTKEHFETDILKLMRKKNKLYTKFGRNPSSKALQPKVAAENFRCGEVLDVE